jgi:cephalosporin-C deacetylase-like acetyl esterase
MAACALDHRIAVAAPTIPFLSDYRDYFEIVQWPGSDIHEYMNNHPEAKWDDVFKVLSYFDIKNLAPWISCPVIMAAGLQDETCPPHTNFAGYNQITSEKEYRIYKDYGHNTPP